jgi:hypothetical protein
VGGTDETTLRDHEQIARMPRDPRVAGRLVGAHESAATSIALGAVNVAGNEIT